MELWGPQAADPQWLPRQLRALAAYERQVNLVPDEPLVVSDDDSDQGSAHRLAADVTLRDASNDAESQHVCARTEDRPKHELPPGTGPKEVRTLVKQLQKLDHANVLRLHEALEDHAHLYFMYEQSSCVTLQSMLETHQWTQEDIVQISRECAAATAYAASMNLLHLSWSLSHVLIPTACAKQPILVKVFGFGLMGVIINDTTAPVS
ncbi:CPK2 [Symbiodinium natans]|uniref:CPK2 protein n=1 Tax=Symbiodinium natans TaxID=878477 RepID=A0A812TTR3_9DINO|nr:CPK2 [Symbiodinium natans]